ncbi:MAG TPA: alpha/beta fold hydrolase [Pseudonocardiaceae bacterium]|nr:alpha/beta fold hydrolase [Pseudonocardiaceae bacterium]
MIRVEFAGDGIDLVGHLRVPDRPGPAVVLTGPFTGVKEQVVGRYAELLTAAGFVTLAFDHRGFGESGGRRGHEDSQGKLADLRAAVDLLAARAEVDPDRIGVVGICLGGGYAVRAAAADPRLAAVVGIAGGYNSPGWLVDRMGLDTYRSALRSFVDRYDDYLPAVAPEGEDAAMGGAEPYAYYGTDRSASRSGRTGSPSARSTA